MALENEIAKFLMAHKPSQGIEQFLVSLKKNGEVVIETRDYKGRGYGVKGAVKVVPVWFPTGLGQRKGARSGKGTAAEALLIAKDVVTELQRRPTMSLEKALAKAKDAAKAAAAKDSDNYGSFNFDNVAVKVNGKWKEFMPPYKGERSRRTAQAEAMRKSLEKSGWDAMVAYHTD